MAQVNSYYGCTNDNGAFTQGELLCVCVSPVNRRMECVPFEAHPSDTIKFSILMKFSINKLLTMIIPMSNLPQMQIRYRKSVSEYLNIESQMR